MPKIIFKSNKTSDESDDLSYVQIDAKQDRMKAKAAESRIVKKTARCGNNSKLTRKQTRSRKTYDQIVVLMRHFKRDPTWNRATVQKVKQELSMKTAQIYKWGYDQKLKNKQESESAKQASLSQFSVSAETDTYITDSAINDYNEAVVKIWNSITSTSTFEGMTGKDSRASSDLDQTILNWTQPTCNSIGVMPSYAKDESERAQSRLFTMSDSSDHVESLHDPANDDFYFEFSYCAKPDEMARPATLSSQSQNIFFANHEDVMMF